MIMSPDEDEYETCVISVCVRLDEVIIKVILNLNNNK